MGRLINICIALFILGVFGWIGWTLLGGELMTGGGRKARLLQDAQLWLVDRFGYQGAGIAFIGTGVVLAGLTVLFGGDDEDEEQGRA